MEVALLSVVAWLAFANGANDNFKGVATLHGSGTTTYATALAVATIATIVGSLVAVTLATGILAAFSGSGLVPAEIAASTTYAASVGGAAAATVLLATRVGMPTSTTHALAGGLVGAAIAVDGAEIAWDRLLSEFFVPLLLSPLAAILLTASAFAALDRIRARPVPSPGCLCVATPARATARPSIPAGAMAPMLVVAPVAECERILGPEAIVARSDRFAAGAHLLSAASVCFARAVNDTPKIAALLACGGMASGGWALALVALAMAFGGLVASRRVAATMSRGITSLDAAEGLTANLVTSSLVIAASRYGLPVSTTHVSCGSIVGVGVATRAARWRTIGGILVTWITTLPLAALLGGLSYRLVASLP